MVIRIKIPKIKLILSNKMLSAHIKFTNISTFPLQKMSTMEMLNNIYLLNKS